MESGVAVADRAQPADVDRAGLDRLPAQIEGELTRVVAVQALAVDPGDLTGDLLAGQPRADLSDDLGADGAHPTCPLQVEPRRVEEQAGHPDAPVVQPQRDDTPAGGVGADHDALVAVALGDPRPGLVELRVVVTDVRSEEHTSELQSLM